MAAKYRVAIIGTGRAGGLIEDERPPGLDHNKPKGHLPAYESIAETEVIAVANRGAERLERFSQRFGISSTYLDYREMIEMEHPDIVSVTTPSVARAEPIIFCAEHGVRGIYAEKGLCASLAEADRVRDALKANNVAFNWGTMRRHYANYKTMQAALGRGAIGERRFAVVHFYTDLIKHHPHVLDLAAMMLGDPVPVWVEGRLAEPDDPSEIGSKRFPTYDPKGHRYLPPPGEELADPMVGFYRVGYENGAEACFVPHAGPLDIEVLGTEGRAWSWDDGADMRIRRGARRSVEISETIIHRSGESPTVSTIRNILHELDTGERTAGNIDITMQSVEVQFGLAHSHLQGGARVSLPVADRSLYIPGG